MDPKRDGIKTDRAKTLTTDRMKVRVPFLFVAFAVLEMLFVLPGASFSAEIAGSSKRLFVEDEVLLRFREGVDNQAKTDAHARVGAKRVKEFKILRGLELAKIPQTVSVEEAIQLYRQNPDVLYAEPNYIVEAQTVPNDPLYGSLWNLPKINAPGAWDLSLGSNRVIVATLDTGIDYNHPDLAANVWRNPLDCNNNGIDDDGNGHVDDCYGINAINNGPDPMDDESHGSHVAGIIGAVGNNGVGVVGVNWNVSIMACKFLGADGSGDLSGVIRCLEYVKLMKDRGENIVATNNSWLIRQAFSSSPGPFSQTLFDAIEEHRKSGILFIASAGNFTLNNDITPTYPASNYQANIISVAATNSGDGLASFSNWGKRTVHISAPGASIISTVPGNQYTSMSGTSMAAPHVSGVAGLLKAYNPQLDWKAIKNLILAGGDNVGSLSNTITQKRLNALEALTCTNSTVSSRIRPVGDRVSMSAGMPINLAVLHINCANPNGDASVVVNPGNQLVTLLDNGLEFDQEAGDGVYSGQWTPTSVGTYTLAFPGGEVLRVDALKSYRFQATSSTYRAITGTNLNLGDDNVASINSPFPILFGGSSFSQLFVSSNGNLSFTTPFSSSENSTIPTFSNIGTLVAPFWDNLFPVSGMAQNVFWAVTGIAPSRELVVEWRDIRHGSCSTDASGVKFQVVFLEGSSNILFNYADTSFGSNCRFANGGGSATVGVQIAGDVGTQFSYNNSTLSKTKAILWTLINDPNFPPPALSAPANNATTVSTTPNFSWSAVPGASSYRIMVANNPLVLPIGPWVSTCSDCVINTTSPSTSFAPTTALTRGTLYYWQVKVEGNSGQPGTWSEQWSFTTDATLPPPTLYVPANGTTGVATEPTFGWSGVTGATSYRIMVATSQAALPSGPLASTCSSCVINATVSGTSFTPTAALSTNTLYYWQVRAEGISGGYWSPTWSFTTANTFQAPILSSPSNGAIGVPTIPMFRWLDVEGAPGYRIMVATSQSLLPTGPTDTRCNKCTINTTSPSESFIPTTGLTPGIVYYWQVRAEGSSGQGGYWSQRRSFTTIPVGSGTVSIASVAPGTVINDFTVLVRGFVNVPSGTEFGVTVNGFIALVDSAQFVAEVQLDETVTELTAVARDAMGTPLGSQTVPVIVQLPTEEPVLMFRSSPIIGPAPLTVSFEMRSLDPISRIDLDLEGNGTADFQGTTLDDKQFLYEGPGLYFPKVTVTNTANNTYTKTTILLVVAQNELETLLQSKWTAMKNALHSGNIASALNYIAISKRADYGQVFSTLLVPFAEIDQVLTDITFIEMNQATAEYQMLRTNAGIRTAYMVRFAIDEDGIWRILNF